MIAETERYFSRHGAAEERKLTITAVESSVSLTTNRSLLFRVLVNMVTNALEATGRGGEVKVGVEVEVGTVAFRVWNRAAIPSDLARRIFQPHFSTKRGEGRGFGTYSMKLLGETLLGGTVTFTTSEAKGTEFRLILPHE